MAWVEQDGEPIVEEFLSDTLHPNDAGYDVIYSLLMKEFGVLQKN